MTRVLSALVLLPVVIGTIWFLPAQATLLLALIAAILAFREYCAIARAVGVSVPEGIGGTAVVLVAYAMWLGDRMFEPNMVALVLLSAVHRRGSDLGRPGPPGPGVLADAAATLFAPIYIGLPLGALASVRAGQRT